MRILIASGLIALTVTGSVRRVEGVHTVPLHDDDARLHRPGTSVVGFGGGLHSPCGLLLFQNPPLASGCYGKCCCSNVAGRLGLHTCRERRLDGRLYGQSFWLTVPSAHALASTLEREGGSGVRADDGKHRAGYRPNQ